MPNTRILKLIASGEFREATDLLSAGNDSSIETRVLRAWSALELGDTETALKLALQTLNGPIPVDTRARCYAIAGRAKGRLGLAAEGLTLLRKALALADEHQLQIRAELLAGYVSASLSWIGVEPAVAGLRQLRRAALECADSAALIEYHIVSARIAALKNAWQKADREIQAAARLLESHPHRTLHWRLRQAQASMAIMLGDLPRAVEHANACVALSRAAGSKSQEASALANLAHITSVAGDVERTQQLLRAAHNLLPPKNYFRFATINTGITIGLASGDEDFAEAMVAQGDALAAAAAEHSYYQLWFILHRVRWLIHRGDFARAADEAGVALVSIERLAETELADRMRLLRAEALAGAGRRGTALRDFADATSGAADRTLETLAETQRLAALLFHPVRPDLAAESLATAWRTLTAAGLLGPRTGLEASARTLDITPERLAAPRPETGADAILQHVSWLLQLGRYLKVLASELLALVHALDACDHAAAILRTAGGDSVIASIGRPGSGGRKAHAPSTADEIVVAAGDDRSYLLRVVPRHPEGFPLLRLALEQVARAAIAAAQSHQTDEQPFSMPFQTGTHEEGMVVGAEPMRELLGTARRLAPSAITALITGETGTGKELLARALHEASPRSSRPFIPFNCSAVARDMLDAQLFGYRKGAFTGANEAFAGVIRAAAGGTLFLDEIGELSLEVQPKLLRFLESGEIHPLGEPRPLHVNVRVVAATNADLEQLVAEGRFREDLFYRLNVVRLQVPPLRERREEIPPIVQHYLERWSREAQKTGIRIADETMEYLILYKWPGNVRQLANEIRRMVALAESGAVLMPEHLSHEIASSRRTIPASERAVAPTEFVVRLDQPMSAAIEHVERSMIQYALRLSGGRLEQAADRLGVSRKGLYLKRLRLGLDPYPEERAHAPVA